jgi:hypothetical protein
MPKRIQLSRNKGWRMPPGAVKVDRSTKWGNPWKWMEFYRPHLTRQPHVGYVSKADYYTLDAKLEEVTRNVMAMPHAPRHQTK